MAIQLSIHKATAWLIAGLLAFTFVPDSWAQGQKKGDASLRIEYQYVHTGAYDGEVFVADYWKTDSHVAMLSGDYALSERWTVYAALPYVQKRFVAAGPDIAGTGPGDPHDPNQDYWVNFVPPDKRFHDDGNYHGGLQDLSIGVMYLAVDGPAWKVSPYIGYAFPASNYPFFAKAAIGKNLWTIPVGVNFSYTPYFSDWHFQGNLAYVFSEEPLNTNVDFTTVYASAGYWFKPNFSMNLFLSAKYLMGGLLIDFDFSDNPFIYPIGYDTEEWWMHDRLLRHQSVNIGIGFDYFLNENYQLSGSYFKSTLSDQTVEIDRAFTLSLTRFFGGD